MPQPTYYDSREEEHKLIPMAECYVLATDTFMSGWGPAERKANIVVVPCPDRETARAVANYARSRPEMMDVSIVN